MLNKVARAVAIITSVPGGQAFGRYLAPFMTKMVLIMNKGAAIRPHSHGCEIAYKRLVTLMAPVAAAALAFT